MQNFGFRFVTFVALALSACTEAGLSAADLNRNGGTGAGGQGSSGAGTAGSSSSGIGGSPGSGGTGNAGAPAGASGTAGSLGVAGAGGATSAGAGGSVDGGGAGSAGAGGNVGGGGAGSGGVGGNVNVGGMGGNVGGAGAGGAGGSGGASSAGGGAGGRAGAAGQSGAAGGASCPNPTTLKAAGTCTGRRVGVALAADHLDEPEYRERALHFNYVTPENEMKWDVTEPSRNTFTFTQGDAIVDFALANGMAVKGHTLLWHNQLPTWLTNLTSASEVRTAMVNHIRGVMTHYRGKVVAWDVVNEAFDDNGVLRTSVFQRTIGSSYIEEAFRAARDADPTVKLYYNDYDIESAYPKADAVYQMVAGLKSRGVPIDGVGMQMHTRNTDEDPPIPEFIANVERLLALGLEVVISEMDVRLCAGGTNAQQARRYHDIVAACVARPGCGDVTIWGITDQYSFLNERTDLQCAGSDPPRPLLWDNNYVQKPAFGTLLEALAGR